ncbi:MAG: hypothetical protein IJU48_10155 [Synergistaceae bacterium]|nr:hypothetical protein [Synergistaceae bacterium]
MTHKKFLPLMLAGLFVFVVIFSVAFTTFEVNHECSGDECPVCLQLNVCSDNLKSLYLSSFILTLCVWICCERSRVSLSQEVRYARSDLIALKVKLSN